MIAIFVCSIICGLIISAFKARGWIAHSYDWERPARIVFSYTLITVLIAILIAIIPAGLCATYMSLNVWDIPGEETLVEEIALEPIREHESGEISYILYSSDGSSWPDIIYNYKNPNTGLYEPKAAEGTFARVKYQEGIEPTYRVYKFKPYNALHKILYWGLNPKHEYFIVPPNSIGDIQ